MVSAGKQSLAFLKDTKLTDGATNISPTSLKGLISNHDSVTQHGNTLMVLLFALIVLRCSICVIQTNKSLFYELNTSTVHLMLMIYDRHDIFSTLK